MQPHSVQGTSAFVRSRAQTWSAADQSSACLLLGCRIIQSDL